MKRGTKDLIRSIGQILLARRMKLAVAESCTGGLLGARITSVAGSSAWFTGGVIAYANDVKQKLLGVPRALLERHGAVSKAAAIAMAKGVRRLVRADFAVAVTGIAGPSGGTRAKPVGTVWIAVGGPVGYKSLRSRFRGGRDRVRRAAVDAALRMLVACLTS